MSVFDERVLNGDAMAFRVLLEHMPFAALVIDERQHVLCMNSAASSLGANNDGLSITEGGMKATMGGQSHHLCRALSRAIVSNSRAEIVTIARPSGQFPYVLSVMPLPTSSASAIGLGMARAVIYIIDPARQPSQLEPRLCAIFGFSPAECKLVGALLADLSPAEIAKRHSVSVATVRSQIQSVLMKTGARRQSQLLNLVNRCLSLPSGTR